MSCASGVLAALQRGGGEGGLAPDLLQTFRAARRTHYPCHSSSEGDFLPKVYRKLNTWRGCCSLYQRSHPHFRDGIYPYLLDVCTPDLTTLQTFLPLTQMTTKYRLRCS